VQLLHNAIEGLFVARRTAIGSAILRSIDAISEVDSRVTPSDLNASPDSPKPAGESVPHIIVVLTDGASNAGPPPLEAAQQAMERGVRVYTIGFGTDSTDSIMDCGSQFQENTFLGGLGPAPSTGSGFHRQIDETTLRQIADLTGGTYSAASSASDLEHVFQNLPTFIVATRQTVEISVLFTMLAAIALIMAVLLSWRWHPLS
jgi:Ca-activated chloride channel family protein